MKEMRKAKEDRMNSMSPDELSEDEKAEADAALNQAVKLLLLKLEIL